MTTDLISIEALSGGYGRGPSATDVLHEISLTVPNGVALALVGESGSGKSTLGRMLVGQLRPRKGAVRIAGTDATALGARQRFTLHRQLQLVPQDPNSSLDPHMTVEQAIAEALNPRRPSPRRDRQRIDELLEMVSLTSDVARCRPHEFSGGQRQRIVIARALAVEPSALVADEVTSALDATVQSEILALLRRLREQQGLGLVFITHDLSIARYLCDQVAVLHHGRVVEHGPVSLLDSPQDDYTKMLVKSVPDPEGNFLHM